MLIDLVTAKNQVALEESDPDGNLPIYIGAAERFASEYLQRNIYATDDALTEAISSAPTAFAAANAAYASAMALVEAMDAGEDREMASFAAFDALCKARQVARMTHQGIVINDHIRSAILLTIASLYLLRENEMIGVSVVSIPMNATFFLDFHRAY